MRNLCSTCIFFILSITGNNSVVHAAGSSPFDAAATDNTVSGIIECGEGYDSHELYDVKITVMEIVRGEQAWQHIKAASKSNPSPDEGTEYILVKIKFEYFARGRPGACVHEVKLSHFTALSAIGVTYTTPLLSIPQPELSGPLSSDESLEGWVAFQVAQDEAKPLMTFSVDDTGAVQHGGKLWFQLYE